MIEWLISNVVRELWTSWVAEKDPWDFSATGAQPQEVHRYFKTSKTPVDIEGILGLMKCEVKRSSFKQKEVFGFRDGNTFHVLHTLKDLDSRSLLAVLLAEYVLYENEHFIFREGLGGISSEKKNLLLQWAGLFMVPVQDFLPRYQNGLGLKKMEPIFKVRDWLISSRFLQFDP